MEHNDRRNQEHESQRNRLRTDYRRDEDRRPFSDDRFGNQRNDEQQGQSRRGGSQPEDVYSHRRGSQDFASPYGSTDDRSRERNFGRHERDYGGSDARRGYEDERHRNEQRPSFSPDWSRSDAQPRYSDEPYYARNREHDEQRDFGSSYPWGERGSNRGREMERDREEDQGHYRGYYSREYRPFSYPGGSGHLLTESWTLTGPHTGRGPKGWKRSDQQIIEEASQRLERDGDVDATDIEVQSENCVITLRGSVPDRATKRRAEETVESIYGVRDVMNELRVSRDEESQSQSSQQASQRSQRGRGSQASQSSSTGARSSGTGPSSASQASQAPSSEEDKKH